MHELQLICSWHLRNNWLRCHRKQLEIWCLFQNKPPWNRFSPLAKLPITMDFFSFTSLYNLFFRAVIKILVILVRIKNSLKILYTRHVLLDLTVSLCGLQNLSLLVDITKVPTYKHVEFSIWNISWCRGTNHNSHIHCYFWWLLYPNMEEMSDYRTTLCCIYEQSFIWLDMFRKRFNL